MPDTLREPLTEAILLQHGQDISVTLKALLFVYTTLLEEHGLHLPGTILYLDGEGDTTWVVEANGTGGAALVQYDDYEAGENNRQEMCRDTFATEREATEAAERMTRKTIVQEDTDGDQANARLATPA